MYNMATTLKRFKDRSRRVEVAFIGGIGGGFLWTAQGAYFAKSAEAYARGMDIPFRMPLPT